MPKRTLIADLPEISTRLSNVLGVEGINSLEEAAKYTRKYWARTPNCGTITLRELEWLLVGHNLEFAPSPWTRDFHELDRLDRLSVHELDFRGMLRTPVEETLTWPI